MDGGAARSSSRLAAVAAFALALLAAGCSCDQPRYCDVDPNYPVFGSSWVRLYHRVVGLPQETAEEFRERGGEFADDAGRYGARFRDDLETTEEHVAGFGPAVAQDFRYRTGEMAGFFGRQADRFGEDSCCFLERAWHVIKLGIE